MVPGLPGPDGVSGRQAACRSCGSAELRPVLSLGRLPLANALLRAEQLGQAEPRYPLDLAFCPDCSLVQILVTVSVVVLLSVL